MLLLSGKVEDKFYIGELGYVQILRICGNGYVQLGFDFPKDIPVDRAKVREAKEAEKAELAELFELTRRAF